MSDVIEIGSHLVTARSGYYHHGIYVGDGMVVHYSGLANGMHTGPVEEVTLGEFMGGHAYSVKKHKNARFSGAEVASRARSRIDEDLYCLFSNNCEHFCEWCVNNDHDSKQVNAGTAVVGSTGATVVGLAARGVVAASGVAVGLSGPGVMSGLATVGGIVGGGAVAGIGVLGAAPGLAMASLVNKTVLKDNPALDQGERKSRSVGRVASYAGVAAGTVGSIGTISAVGSVAGLSGAGITSGLAAIGATVGGGMASGVVIATAAPVGAAVAAGYGVYRLVKWLKAKPLTPEDLKALVQADTPESPLGSGLSCEIGVADGLPDGPSVRSPDKAQRNPGALTTEDSKGQPPILQFEQPTACKENV